MFSVFKNVILDVRSQWWCIESGTLHLKSRFTIFTALAAIQEIPEWLLNSWNYVFRDFRCKTPNPLYCFWILTSKITIFRESFHFSRYRRTLFTACWGGGSDKKFCNQILKAVSNAYDPLEWQGLFKKIPAWYWPLHKISKNYFM